jgi:hypothetical protein
MSDSYAEALHFLLMDPSSRFCNEYMATTGFVKQAKISVSMMESMLTQKRQRVTHLMTITGSYMRKSVDQSTFGAK